MNDLNYLSDIEKELVAAFIKHDAMMEAVRKVLLAGIYYNGVLKPGKEADSINNFALSLFMQHQDGEVTNEQLGQDLRAASEGILSVERSFKKMLTLLPKEPKEENKESKNIGA